MAQEQVDTGLRKETLRLMEPYFQQYLVPHKIVPKLNMILEDKREHILDIEENQSRQAAVKELIKVVLEKEDWGINHFIFVLRGDHEGGVPAWERYLMPLENKSPEQLNRTANEYYAFIVRLLEFDIIQKLSEGEIYEIILHLLSAEIIDDADMEKIWADFSAAGRYQAAVQMFTVMQRRREDWPLAFFCALQKAKPELLPKIDPLNESPLTKEKDGRMTSNISQRPGGSSKERRIMRELNDDQETYPKRIRAGAEVAGGHDRSLRAPVSDDQESSDAPDFSDCEEKYTREDSEKKQKGNKTSVDRTQGQLSPGPTLQNHDGMSLAMRKYQMELADPALKGENVIICAPTGSGKTRVALYIVQHHLLNPPRDKCKVAFLARTVPLVTQQFKIFRKYLSTFKSVLVTGESDNSMQVHHLLKDYDILVLTPKILENHLVPEKIPSLTAFSLLVFDECHHTRKGEPYNCLMKSYLRSKENKETGLPQIVGLTASIGVEKASTESEAKESILGIMGNLDVQKISTVRENLRELESTVPKPEEGRSVRLMSRDNDEISSRLQEAMGETESILTELGRNLDNEEIMKILEKRPGDRKDQKYGQWAVKLKNQARLLKLADASEEDPDEVQRHKMYTRKIQVYADCLAAYNDALEVHDLVRPQDVLEFLERKFQQHALRSAQERKTKRERKIVTMFDGLESVIMGQNFENPNLEILAKTIMENLNTGAKDGSQIIIFVRTRATCLALCKWLNSHPHLKQLNATQFTGTGARQDEGGMTPNEQEAVIEKFRSGEIKVLVSTSVGEEGIDIPDCNLVIKYNQVGNEVTTVQTRGRSRKKGGQSILMAKDKIMQQEMMNRYRAEMMYKAIEMVSAMSPREIETAVRKVQRKTLEEEDIKEIVRTVKKKCKLKQSFCLICGRCKNVRVSGDSIRTINNAHHVVIGQQLAQQVNCRKGGSERVDDVVLTGTLFCGVRSCGNSLGRMLNYMGVNFMTLAIRQWIVEDEAHNLTSHKSWSKVPFHVKPIRPDDVRRHVREMEGDDESEESED